MNAKRIRTSDVSVFAIIAIMMIVALSACSSNGAPGGGGQPAKASDLDTYTDFDDYEANNKAIISKVKTAVIAAQAIIADAYGSGTTPDASLITLREIQELSGDTSITSVGGITLSGTQIEKLTVEANGKVGTFDANRTPQYQVE